MTLTSTINAEVAELLGNTRFNLAWGGSTAIRVEVFRQLGLDKVSPPWHIDRAVETQPCCIAPNAHRTWSCARVIEAGKELCARAPEVET
jgi:hypothetical protein